MIVLEHVDDSIPQKGEVVLRESRRFARQVRRNVALPAIERIGNHVLAAHLGVARFGAFFGGLGYARDGDLLRNDRVDASSERQLHRTSHLAAVERVFHKRRHHRAERAHVVERRAHEVANLLVKLRIILLELLYVFRIDAKRFERASIVHVENGAILHVDVETGIVLLHRFDVVAHFALQAYVRDDAVSGFRVDARHIASIRVTVGVAVLDIEVDNEIVTVLDRIAHGYASWIWSDSASRFSKRFWF